MHSFVGSRRALLRASLGFLALIGAGRQARAQAAAAAPAQSQLREFLQSTRSARGSFTQRSQRAGGCQHKDFVARLDARAAAQLRQGLVLAVDGDDAHVRAGH